MTECETQKREDGGIAERGKEEARWPFVYPFQRHSRILARHISVSLGNIGVTMKSFALVLASVFAASLPCQAELVYDFSFTSTTSPIQSFSFSIDSPAFIGPGSSALPPFTITDGSNVWTLDQDLVGISTGVILGSTLLPAGDGCFAFGSSGAVLTNYVCGVAIPNQGTSEAAFCLRRTGWSSREHWYLLESAF
jgi:hypothetical protein